MAEYNFNEIESKWQRIWEEQNLYQTENDKSKPKYYVLDMFPYPSGVGLHVGGRNPRVPGKPRSFVSNLV